METRPTSQSVKVQKPVVLQRIMARVAGSLRRKTKRQRGEWIPRFLRSKYDPRNGRFHCIKNASSQAEAYSLATSVPRGADERTNCKALRLADEWKPRED